MEIELDFPVNIVFELMLREENKESIVNSQIEIRKGRLAYSKLHLGLDNGSIWYYSLRSLSTVFISELLETQPLILLLLAPAPRVP